jgi:hypothetical protein
MPQQTPGPQDATGSYRNAPTAAPAGPSAPAAPPPDTVTFQGALIVDPGSLSKAVMAFRMVAEDAAAAGDVAQGQVRSGAGGVPEWGSDPLGQAFGSQYAPVVSGLVTALQAVSQLFETISGQLANTVSAFGFVEERNVDLASSL